jgi:PIN domain nuclease of toxin-antitoxin system
VSPGILLDTCALLWIAEDTPIDPAATQAIDEAYAADLAVCASPISAWEIGLLVARNRLALSMAPAAWFRQLATRTGLALCPLEPDTLIEASFLPGSPPRDPADRIILATARALTLRVLTRDRAILAYARDGHVAAIPC